MLSVTLITKGLTDSCLSSIFGLLREAMFCPKPGLRRTGELWKEGKEKQ
jgi:hypothetical protein